MNVKPHIISSFLERTRSMGLLAAVLSNPTEELVESVNTGRKVDLFARGLPMPRKAPGSRLEENYLYSSVRFPNSANNTIGAGAVAAGTYTFFSSGVGGDGATMGYPTSTKLTDVETNLEGVGGQVAKGTNFVFNQIGVSFGADSSPVDIAQLLEAGALRFVKSNGQFTLFHGKPLFWPGGMGIGAQTATANTGGSNGAPDIRAVRALKIPRVIRENETFGYQFVVPSANKRKNGAAIALGDFVVMTIWLWGGHQIAIAV